ncbi:class F sortase [Plantactinospora sp. B5E13]|uniref:class F sortase n=1 Tax=Plantactinospora sp. B5E13 TaxID=3153758 RepID=UPI00325CEC4A
MTVGSGIHRPASAPGGDRRRSGAVRRPDVGGLLLCLALGAGLAVTLAGDGGPVPAPAAPPTRLAACPPACAPAACGPACETGAATETRAAAAAGDTAARPAEPAPSGPPTRVRIPRIRVDSTLAGLRLDRTGRLPPPAAFSEAGWYADGVVPGDVGPAVLAGHVDSKTGPAVFHRLADLEPGDLVEVRRGHRWLRFRVTGSSRHAKAEFPTTVVYGPTPGPELRLITCTGRFDRPTGHYRDNLVVYAVAELPVVLTDSAAG